MCIPQCHQAQRMPQRHLGRHSTGNPSPTCPPSHTVSAQQRSRAARRAHLHHAQARVELVAVDPAVGALCAHALVVAVVEHQVVLEHGQHHLATAVDDGADAVEDLKPLQRARRVALEHGVDQHDDGDEDDQPGGDGGGATCVVAAPALDGVVLLVLLWQRRGQG
jgi:hypothetical protein